MDWRDVLLAVAFASAGLFFSGPAFAMWKANSVIKYAPHSYWFMLVSAGLWAVYGADWSLAPLCWVSVIGVLVWTSYLYLFLWRCDPDDPRLTYLLCFVAGGSALVIAAVGYDFLYPKTVAYGIICSAVSCLASAAPLYNAPRAFRESSMECMPSIFIPAFAFLNALFWTARNTTLKGVRWIDVDYNLVVSSTVAALCALAQLLMPARARFWRSPPPPPTGGLEEPFLYKEGGAEGAAATPVAVDNVPQPPIEDAQLPHAMDPPAVHVLPA